jgi:regulator of replication initiation timing
MNAAELTTEVSVLSERIANQHAELLATKATVQRLEAEIRTAREEAVVVRSRLDELVKKTDTWDGRRWGLVMALVSFACGVGAGLIVALVRKP